MKKTLITLICMLTFFCSFTARANEPPLDIGWNIENGILTVNGNGAMPDYANPEDTPWFAQRNEINKIIINDGITHIGNLAFYGLTNATEAIVPESVESIGLCAFSYTEGTRTAISDLDSPYMFELATDACVVSAGDEFTVSVNLTADLKDLSLIQTVVLFDMEKIAVDKDDIFDHSWLETLGNDNIGYLSMPMGGIVANNVRIAYLSLDGKSIDSASPLYTAGKATTTVAKIKCKALCDIEDINASCLFIKNSAVSLSDGQTPKCGETQLTTVTRLPMPNLTINGAVADEVYEQSKPASAPSAKELTVIANGSELTYDVAPFIDGNGVVMLPLRHTAESLGIVVSWHSSTRTVFLTTETELAAIQMGQNMIFKNSGNADICANAVILNNRTILPLEFFEKAFGFKTIYDKETNTVTITN